MVNLFSAQTNCIARTIFTQVVLAKRKKESGWIWNMERFFSFPLFTWKRQGANDFTSVYSVWFSPKWIVEYFTNTYSAPIANNFYAISFVQWIQRDHNAMSPWLIMINYKTCWFRKFFFIIYDFLKGV